jgi:hypothetical protein
MVEENSGWSDRVAFDEEMTVKAKRWSAAMPHPWADKFLRYQGEIQETRFNYRDFGERLTSSIAVTRAMVVA